MMNSELMSAKESLPNKNVDKQNMKIIKKSIFGAEKDVSLHLSLGQGNENHSFPSGTFSKTMREIFIIHYSLF